MTEFNGHYDVWMQGYRKGYEEGLKATKNLEELIKEELKVLQDVTKLLSIDNQIDQEC